LKRKLGAVETVDVYLVLPHLLQKQDSEWKRDWGSALQLLGVGW